jgi:hypothetical protein
MHGSQLGVLGFTIQRAAQTDNPRNLYLFGEFLLPSRFIKQSTTKGARLASLRLIPHPVMPKSAPVQTKLQAGNQNIYASGITPIPNAGIWATIGKGAQS